MAEMIDLKQDIERVILVGVSTSDHDDTEKSLDELEEGYYYYKNYKNLNYKLKNVKNAKKAIKKAFQNQIDGKGFSLVEVISSCPTNWGMTPKKALEWIDEKMIPYYPLGVYKDRSLKEEE